MLLVAALDRVSRGGVASLAGILERLGRAGVGVKSLREEWLDTMNLLFVGTTGELVDGDNLDRLWNPALLALGIRPRGFYHCRHTFITAALMRGAKVQWVAKYCGTSLATIQRHYAKWLGGDADQLTLLGGDDVPGDLAPLGGDTVPGEHRDAVPIPRAETGKSGKFRALRLVRKTASNR